MSYEVKVSVIIPTFNREATILRALESVLAQSFQDMEVIIIDDGSEDNTESILAPMLQKIRYFKTTNKGVSAARNLAVSQAKGRYLAFLDSDDSWHSDKLKHQLDYLEANPETRWVHCEELWIRNGVRVNQMKKHKKGSGNQFIPSLKLCLISPSAIVLEKILYEQAGGFREDFPVCEDYDLWLKLTHKNSIGFIETPLVSKYGGHDDQLSRKYFAMDYWRVKSIDWVLDNLSLSEEQKNACVDVLSKKGRVLLKGYEKHNNLANLPEVKAILERWV